jgi:peptidyl-dipeptidase Dcp
MKKTVSYLLMFVMIMVCTIFISSCKKTAAVNKENPFFTELKTPFKTPDFGKIDTAHYMPAFEEGMKRHNEEIQAIINDKEEPGFENTIMKFDKSGKLLNDVSLVFFNLTEANTNDQMQKIAEIVTPMLSNHNDEISMNPELFKRIKAVYDKRGGLNLDSQQMRVLEKYYLDFKREGAELSAEDQKTLKSLNSELSSLSLKFGDNVLAETKAFKLVIDNQKDLEGLPETSVSAAADAAKEAKMDGKWVFTLDKPSMIPFLQYAKNRALREKIYRGYFMRGDNGNANDNKEIITKMTNLRQKKAQLLGFKSYSAYVIDQNMAKTPEAVDQFLMKLWKPALPIAKKELAEMQKIVDREKGNFKIQPWDWWYYAEIVRKEKFNIDENEIKPYLKLENVRDGMFEVAKRLYGIKFEKRTDIPLYHPDVETFEVKEADGRHIGILYLDYYPRDSKRGGAWCTSFRNAGFEDGKVVDPLISIVCNFTKPAGDNPALLSWDETLTLFHEFGHGLHFLLVEGKYNRTAGNVPNDYVELPSQVMENWAGDKEVLKLYAKHFKTNEIMPDELIAKLNNSSLFNQGFETVEYVAASLLDLDYHNITKQTDFKTNDFEKASMAKIGLIPEILPRYRSTYFNHIFSGGYSAGYYVYIWAAVLDADAFDAFKQSGDVFNKDLAAKFRKYCLQESGDDEGMIQYKKFRGKDPAVEPLLKRRGLN